MGPEGDSGPEDADDLPPTTRPVAPGTELDPRFTLANERTFLAWIRTGLALVVAGLAVTQFFRPFSIAYGRRIIGVPLIGLGAIVAFWCFWRWRNTERAMREGTAVPVTNLPATVAAVVGAIGLVGLVLVLIGGNG